MWLSRYTWWCEDYIGYVKAEYGEKTDGNDEDDDEADDFYFLRLTSCLYTHEDDDEDDDEDEDDGRRVQRGGKLHWGITFCFQLVPASILMTTVLMMITVLMHGMMPLVLALSPRLCLHSSSPHPNPQWAKNKFCRFKTDQFQNSCNFTHSIPFTPNKEKSGHFCQRLERDLSFWG